MHVKKCFINAILVEIGVDVPPFNVSSRCSAKTNLPAIIHKEATNALDIARDRIKGWNKFFYYDGPKRSMNHIIKDVSWWHIDRMIIF